MIRKNFAVVSMGLLASVAVAGGCKKNDKAADKAPAGGSAAAKAPEKAGDKPAEKPASNGAPVAAGDDLAYLPAASDVVAQIDLGKLRGSALYKSMLEPKLREALEKDGKFAQFKAKCGMDPVADLTSISIGMSAGTDNPAGVVVVHGLDKTKTMDCMEKTKTEMEAEGSKYTVDGNFVTVTTKTNETSVFTFVDGNTAVMQAGPGVTKDTLTAVLSGAAGVKSSAAFMDLYNKTNAGTVRFLVNGNMKQLQNNPLNVKPKAIFGSLDVTDGLGLNVAARLGSDAEASQLAATLKGQVSQAAAFVSKADVTSEGSDVRIDVAMSSAQLTSLAGMAGGMMR